MIPEEQLKKLRALINDPGYLVMVDALSDEQFHLGPGKLVYNTMVKELRKSPGGTWYFIQANNFRLDISKYHSLKNITLYKKINLDEHTPEQATKRETEEYPDW